MATNSQKINAKDIARYVLLPGIIPRLKGLFTGGFGYLAFLFASVYGGVRILPSGHPYLNPDNIGKFGVLDVVRAAANALEFKRKNIDQIIVFFLLAGGLVLFVLQFVLLFLTLLTGKAFAGTGAAAGPFKSMFLTPHPQSDIAFLLLDYVFGIPASGGQTGSEAFFGSNALSATGGPTPFHQGLHALFNFYNLAILLVAVLIFLYFVFVVVIETAKTGVPFGQRFSKLYAPFRLIIAVGLLVPLNYGFNGAQYITLYAAKLGSSFATNGWVLYNRTLQNPMGVKNASLIAKPNVPSIDNLLFFSSVYHACREAYKIWVPKDYGNPQAGGITIKPYILAAKAEEGKPVSKSAPPIAQDFTTYSYQNAKDYFGTTDIEIILGEYVEDDANIHKEFAGRVRPYCGKITLSLTHDNPAIFQNSGGSEVSRDSSKGVRAIEAMYYGTVQQILRSDDSSGGGKLAAFGERLAHFHNPSSLLAVNSCYKADTLGDSSTCGTSKSPPTSAFQQTLNNYRSSHDALVQSTYNTYRNSLNLKLNDQLEKRGWGGAGIWYNQIADLNGTFTGAIYATPSIRTYPEVMEFVKQERQKQNKMGTICTFFDLNLSNAQSIKFQRTTDESLARAMTEAYKYFACTQAVSEAGSSGGSTTARERPKGMTANMFIDVINLVFGINGLYEIRENSKIDPNSGQPAVHPLAQLSTVGKSLVENAIRSVAMAVGASFGSGILGALGFGAFGASLQAASSMFVGIATIGLTAGFILYYILPFLPFIYFFFAVGSWVKSIFEAMVGAPLWALAHLRIDGDGLPGRAANGGYFLVFEIFLRPIVIVFGLIGGMAVFGAMAGMLNELFDLVVTNVTGVPPGASTSTISGNDVESIRRGVIDQFFFTIMYAVLLYMMATASFKMIDTVPQHVMTWIGSGVQTFNDNAGDPTANLTQYAAAGGSQVTEQVVSGATGGSKSIGEIGGSLMKSLASKNEQG